MRRARTSSKSAEFSWRLGAEGRPVVVAGPAAAPVVAQLGPFLEGWDPRPSLPGDVPDIEIGGNAAAGFAVSGAFGAETGFVNEVDAANALAGALVMVEVARDPMLVCLHAGAARIGGGVVGLVGDSGAGKSSVALMLAASGHLLYGDDRLGLRLGGAPQAVAFGLAPKARLPLPPDCGAEYGRFVADRTVLSGAAAAYLRMQPGEQAPRGAAAPLAALVVLARGAAEEGLELLSPAAAVRALVPHCYAAGRPAVTLVRDLETLARLVPVLRLAFAESRRAAGRIAAAFAPAPAGCRPWLSRASGATRRSARRWWTTRPSWSSRRARRCSISTP